MAMQAPPIVFQQLLDLTSLGVNASSCSFQTLTMESEKYICVREAAEGGQGGNVVIIDMDKPNSPVKHAITADSAIMNPSQYILALRSQQTLQIFNIAEKMKLKSFNMGDPVVYWRWLTPTLMGIVTTKAVFHWDTSNASDPVKMYDRLKELENHQIISYRADASLKWFCLVGLAQENGRVAGWTQLYSADKNVAQPLRGQAATFARYTPPGSNQELTLFCFAHRTAGESKLIIREVNRTNATPESSANKFGAVAAITFPDDAASDFPVSMEVSNKYDVIYLVTRMGLLHIFDIATGKLIYMNRIAHDKDTIFVTTPYKGGMLGVNKAGKVLSINLNEQTIIPYIMSKPDVELATKLAARANLPGADDLFMKQFQALMAQGRYAEASRVAAEAPAALLRTPQTIQLFQTQPARQGEPAPILQYFGALMERGKLNPVESVTLVRLVAAQRKDLIEKWLGEDKLDWSEEIGDTVRPFDRTLAIKIYIKADAKEKAAFGLAEEGHFDKLVAWAKTVNYNPDWLKLIGALVQANPAGAAALAKLLLTNQVEVSREAIVDIFVKRNLIREVTELVIDVNKNQPEDGGLQTLILELNLLNAPTVAEFIFAQNLFSQFNKKRIAELCEKAGGPLNLRALQLYTDLADRKRVLRAAHTMPAEAVAEWFSTLNKNDSLDCLKEMLTANARQNLPVTVLVAQRFHELFGALPLVQLFESVKSYEGIHMFLNPLLPLINDPDVIFKFIEAAARIGQVQDVERVCRESKAYNPEKVRDFLKEIKLSSPLPLIIVCDTYGYIADMVKYLSKNSMRQAIEGYVTQMSPGNTPVVVGTLLDVDDGSGADDFVKNILNLVGSRCPIEPLVKEVESRNKLRLIQSWLEARANEGNQETALHNALLKIYIDTRNDPERRLTENKFYDHKEVGRYCEGRDAQLAFLAYSTSAGTCDDEIIAISNKASLMKQLAKYLIKRRDQALWSKVLSNDNAEHRRALVDQVQAVLPESTVSDEIVITVSAFRVPHLNLEQELIGLVEKIIFQGANEEFKTYPQLQNLLLLTAIRAWKPDFQTRVMEYIKRLDKYDVDAVAEASVAAGLFEEAFTALQKFEKFVPAIDVLLNNLHSLDRAHDFADQCDKPEVFTRLGKAQLDAGAVPDAIASFIKASDAQFYHEVVAAIHSSGSEKLYHELIKFLQMARRQLNESKIDSELIYAFAKTGSIAEIEQFLSGAHRANVQDIGERCFDEGNYQAAKVLFGDIKNYARLATTLVKLDDLASAVEMARKANSVSTWKAISKACVEAKNFKLARTCGLNIIIHGDELAELIRFYENRGHFDELIALIEAGLELERAHSGMFTEVAVLYAQHRPEKLLDHLRANHTKLNAGRVTVACEQNLLWKELALLLQQEKDFDKCAVTMMDHPVAFDAQTFPGILAKATSTENIARGIRFFIEEHPAALSDLLTAVSGRLDHRRVIDIARETGTLPLIKSFLLKAQEANVQVVNEALNDILIDEEDYNALRTSIESHNAFEPIALAKRLERHELLEFRRIAASLYKAKSKWAQAIELFKTDKQFQDAMIAAAESKDRKIAEDLLQYFIAQGHPEAFSAALYHCYDILRPDVVLELAWRNKMSDFAMPFLIQSFSDLHTKVEQLAEAMLKRREENQAIQAQVDATHFATSSNPVAPHIMTGIPPHMGSMNPTMTVPNFPVQFGSNPTPGFVPAPHYTMSNPGPTGPFAPGF